MQMEGFNKDDLEMAKWSPTKKQRKKKEEVLNRDRKLGYSDRYCPN